MEETRRRRSIRLSGYDYARSGAYFVTVCTQDRACLFGDVVAGEMQLNDGGRMVRTVWDELAEWYPGVETDAFVVMPNHVHGIVILVGAGPRACPVSVSGQPQGVLGQPQGVAPTVLALPDVMHRFKSLTTTRYGQGVRQAGWPPFPGRLWQRNYYEHIVRDEASLTRIRIYIRQNAVRWESDRENPLYKASGIDPSDSDWPDEVL